MYDIWPLLVRITGQKCLNRASEPNAIRSSHSKTLGKLVLAHVGEQARVWSFTLLKVSSVLNPESVAEHGTHLCMTGNVPYTVNVPKVRTIPIFVSLPMSPTSDKPWWSNLLLTIQ